MAQIVILGQSGASVAAALQLSKLMRPEDWITLIAPCSRVTNPASLPALALGLRTEVQVSVDLEPLFRLRRIKFIEGTIKALYPKRHVVQLEGGRRIPYDYLILGEEAQPVWNHIPGLSRNHDMVHSLFSTDGVLRTRLAFEEFNRHPGPMLVGCAPGALDYPAAYEFVLQADHMLRKRRIRHKVPIHFITSEPYPGHFGIGGIGESNRFFERYFREHHIQWRANAAIEHISQDSFQVLNFDQFGQSIHREEIISRFSCLWPAMGGPDWLRHVEGLTDERGYVKTNNKLQSLTYPDIFALGDIVANKPVDLAPMETGQPCTGFLSESMASTVAGNLAERLYGREPCYEPTGNGFFIMDFGDSGAAFIAMPQQAPRNIDHLIEGRWVHLAHRVAERYYLRKLKLGISDPIFEKLLLRLLKIKRLTRLAA